MADLTDEEFDALPIIGGLTEAEFDALPIIGQQEPLGTFDTIAGGAQEFMQGPTFGFWDEIGGGIRSLFTGNTAAEETAALRGREEAFEEEHPYGAPALNVAGAGTAALMTGGASAAGSGGGILSGLARALYSTAPARTATGRVLGGAVAGGLTGGLTGAGEAEGAFAERLAPALAGGAIGIGTGGLIGLAGEGGRKVVGHYRDKGLTPAQKVVRNVTKNTPDEFKDRAALRLAAAEDAGSPEFITEALDSATASGRFRQLARSDKIADNVQSKLKDRLKDTGKRMRGILDDVLGPADDLAETGESLIETAKETIGEAKLGRSKQVSPVFRRAFDEVPIIPGERMEKLAQRKTYQRIVRELRDTLGEDIADIPDNSSHMAQRVLEVLGDKIEKARNSSSGKIPQHLSILKKQIEAQVREHSPRLASARALHKSLSPEVSELMDGPVGQLSRLKNKDAARVGRAIVNLKPTQFKRLQQSFSGRKGELRAAVRAHLDDVLGATRGDFESVSDLNSLNSIIGTDNQRKNLSALFGSENYSKLYDQLAREGRIREGQRALSFGSPTQPAQEELKGLLQDMASPLAQALRGPRQYVAKVAEDVVGTGLTDETLEELATILTSSKAGRDTLDALAASPERTLSPEMERLIQALATRVAPAQTVRTVTDAERRQ